MVEGFDRIYQIADGQIRLGDDAGNLEVLSAPTLR
jgi:hypothetical protein